MKRAAFLSSAHIESLPSGTSDAAPEWVHLIPSGEFSGRYGRGPYTLDSVAVEADFAANGLQLPIDYEHQSLNADKNGQPAPAAGWITALETRDDGLWGKVDWTEQGGRMVAAHEYRYISPFFRYETAGRVTGLISAALVSRPNLSLTAMNSQLTQGDPMNDILERLRYLFNLPTLADEAAIVSELDKLKERLAAPETAAMREALKLPADARWPQILEAVAAHHFSAPESLATPSAAMSAMSATLAELKTDVQAMSTRMEEKRIEDALGAALAAHRISPAQVESARKNFRENPESFAAFLAGAPVIMTNTQTAFHAAGSPIPPVPAHPLLADLARRTAK